MFIKCDFKYFSLKNLIINNQKPQTINYTNYNQKYVFFTPSNKKITLTNPLKDITLIFPLKWDAWDKEFKIKIKSNNL